MAASQKLSHLLKLADQGPALRAALAEEVADLLTNWPSDYPESMRGACEALLARAEHDVDAGTRTRLKAQLHSNPELASRVLPEKPTVRGLIETARQGGNLAGLLAERLGVNTKMARQILDDRSGIALAVACKGASLDRATFSALALLVHPRSDRGHAYAMLDTFDKTAMSEAMHVVQGWREGRAAA